MIAKVVVLVPPFSVKKCKRDIAILKARNFLLKFTEHYVP
ncbi:hypothetical protein CSC17_0480 [Klebsiella oxytoca]|nr:hypothetical protein CSC17_0480 [Klebsiella oxytoca]EUC83249.1 hypothetical protein HMPREF1570_4177 [Klebsiella oxytoca KA-2]